MKINQIKQIKEITKRFFQTLFNRPICIFLILILVDLLFGAILLWRLILSPNVNEKLEPLLVLNKNGLDKFVENWIKQEQDFESIDSVSYQNIFLGFFNQKIQENSTSSLSTTSKSY